MNSELNLLESNYRRGYCSGYDQAIMDIKAMLLQDFSPEECIRIAREFYVEDLVEWRSSDWGLQIYPSKPRARKYCGPADGPQWRWEQTDQYSLALSSFNLKLE